MSETVKAENGPITSTVVVEDAEETHSTLPSVRMKLKKPKAEKKVAWSPETVDNENMNKKKSKCCCIYEKPREFGESSSDSDDECDNCKGHVERKHRKPPTSSSNDNQMLLPVDQGDSI